MIPRFIQCCALSFKSIKSKINFKNEIVVLDHLLCRRRKQQQKQKQKHPQQHQDQQRTSFISQHVQLILNVMVTKYFGLVEIFYELILCCSKFLGSIYFCVISTILLTRVGFISLSGNLNVGRSHLF